MPLTCDECGKIFTCKRNLTDHTKRIHQKERNFVCPNCPKSFFCKTELASHIRTHDNSKKLTCQYDNCNYSYTWASNYKIHVNKVHTQNKDFPCPYSFCHKKFYTGGALQSHINTHEKKGDNLLGKIVVFRKKQANNYTSIF